MRYYSIHRPVFIGTYPNADDVTAIVNYDAYVHVDAINRPAYGHIDYAHELTTDEQAHYDLIPATMADASGANLRKVITALWRYANDEARFDRVWKRAKSLYGYTDEELADAFALSGNDDAAIGGIEPTPPCATAAATCDLTSTGLKR